MEVLKILLIKQFLVLVILEMANTKRGLMESLLLNITYGNKYFVDVTTKIKKKNMELIMKYLKCVTNG